MSYDLNGKYEATLGKGVLSESKGGALMYYMEVNVEGVPPMRGAICLIKRDGEMMTKNVKNLIAILDGRWDGVDIAALETIDPTGVSVLAECADGAPNDKGNVYTEVKNVYPPNGGGGGQKLPEAGDAKSIAAKYGSQFRAIFGGKPTQSAPAKTAPAPSAPPAAKAPPPAAKPPPKAPPVASGPTSTMNDCWGSYWAKYNALGMDDNAIQAQWVGDIAATFGGKAQAKLTSAEWGRFMAEKCAADDGNPL